MAYRATLVSQDPLSYFLDKGDGEPYLHISDVLLRVNQNPKEVFAHLIRIATNSKWSHSALVYLNFAQISDRVLPQERTLSKEQ